MIHMKASIVDLRCWLVLFSLAASLHVTLGYYDPAAQRWINRDPLGERASEMVRNEAPSKPWGQLRASEPHNSDSSAYEFVLNKPINNFDAIGLQIWSIFFPPSLGGNPLNCTLLSRTDPIVGDPRPGNGNHNGESACIWRCNRWGDEIPRGPPTSEVTFAKAGCPCPVPRDGCGGKANDVTGRNVRGPWLTPPNYE